MKRSIFLINIIFHIFVNCSKAQEEYLATSAEKFIKLYNSGDIINAENCLLQVIEKEEYIPEKYGVFIYSNLGSTSLLFGRYKNAMKYYDLAEKYIKTDMDSSSYLCYIYTNKAIIYGYQKLYPVAIDFFEKGIRIYEKSIRKGNGSYLDLSKAYMNLGIIYYELEDYKLALNYFNKSQDIKTKMKLPGLGLVYLNIAKVHVKMIDQRLAELYFIKSISEFKHEYNKDYLRLSEVYIEYGKFLHAESRHSEVLEAYKKALSICLKNYGDKHTFVSLSYKYLGDHFTILEKYDSALYYYQKSLIAVVPDFNDDDIFQNPSIDSALFDIRLLDNLKSKSRALGLLSGKQGEPGEKLKLLRKSLETSDLAMALIDNIRANYPSEESRLYLAENEKDTYASAIRLASDLYLMDGEEATKQKIYNIARKAKAAVLRDEITGNDILANAGIPDSLLDKRNNLSAAVSAYNNLIREESGKKSPDSSKIEMWKDALFDMNRESEEVTDYINTAFPQYYELFLKTEPMPLSEIQSNLDRKEAIIDYFLCNRPEEGSRDLYIFVITGNRLEYITETTDSLFSGTISLVRNYSNPPDRVGKKDINPASGLKALYSLYQSLVMPVEKYLPGEKLIIIPDEEISWVPFDALLSNSPASDNTNYEGLDYLINKYTFSYGYSSSLIFGKSKSVRGGEKVFAFAPDYNNFSGTARPDDLPGAGTEIESAYKCFSGKKYSGYMASETNFRSVMHDPAIFHLAMHSVSDTLNSKYSYFLFDNSSDSLNDGRLYNYEISLGKISSPMVVLSACNSGAGTLYLAEGLMSLARGFIIAGASSVIKTSWEVNDEVSAKIISGFYNYLSKGKARDEAMRSAKLDFIGSNPPSLSNPYYWAAYEVLGDNGPVVNNRYKLIPLIIVLFACGAAGLFYFRRRRISAARPE